MHFSACAPAIFQGRTVASALPAIAATGLKHYEFWGWWDEDMDALLAMQRQTALQPAALCTRFISLTDPTCRSAYLDGLRETVGVAEKLGCPVIISQVGQERAGIPRSKQHQSLADGLRAAAPLLEGTGICLCIEPLNTKVDHPGYYLWQSQEAFNLIDEVNHPQIKVLFDMYHQHIMEGLEIGHILRNLEKIGHFHMAGDPGRHEPFGKNDIDYLPLLRAIRDAGYTGSVGLEYKTLKNPQESLAETVNALKI